MLHAGDISRLIADSMNMLVSNAGVTVLELHKYVKMDVDFHTQLEEQSGKSTAHRKEASSTRQETVTLRCEDIPSVAPCLEFGRMFCDFGQ